MTHTNDATERQRQAAQPKISTWLAANAGSGKTRVLTDRVARLLLEGVQPQHILCLTYTKAAASEMQNRLFGRLGSWAMLDDAALGSTLRELGAGDTHDPVRLRQARTLFARAIETPGGLKIQTIHSFCASLLRRFPLEAQVSPQFTEIEERAASLLRAEIVEDLADGDQAALVDGIARYISDVALDNLTAAIVGHREDFARVPGRDALWRIFDLPPGLDEHALLETVFLGGEMQMISDLIPILRASGTNDQKAASKLSGVSCRTTEDLETLEDVFLTKEKASVPFSAKIGVFPTKAVQRTHPDLVARLDPFMRRVEEARPLRLGLAAADKALALHDFAAAFLPEYERRKLQRGWLDFDDLILKARHLLNNPEVANWVLFRLDGGIDHILVDEAQDTSPEQWHVIEKLAQEFTSGQGARAGVERTIFVVGDKKQSIYSFQGADPDAFDRMQAEFSRRLSGSGSALENLALEFSFRSSDAILRLVDTVFEGHARAGFTPKEQHRAFKKDLPGRVDLWPVVEPVEDDDDRSWTDPVDRPGRTHHAVVLADRIARFIRTTIDDRETIPEDGSVPGSIVRRQVHEGDFLILVQRRSELFSEIIRACKAMGLRIAGADRLKVGAELAVKDLAAVLAFLATPEDDLSLATVLKSPLFGWSEKNLFDLAHGRDGKYLWQALRDQAEDYSETLTVLNDLRDRADFLRPYDLIERILTRHEGRKRLLARLGPEAEDGINALLSQALAYERTDVPSLTGFLVWMETDDLEIKRQMGTAGDMIRVMTVHGAKGLEAPIVILPDTAERKPRQNAEIAMIDGVPVWTTRAEDTPPAMQIAKDAMRQREAEERLRLLYVAMTRAEKWLIVAAAGKLSSSGDSWYQMIEQGLIRQNAEKMNFFGGQGLRLSHLDWTEPERTDSVAAKDEATHLPEWCRRAAAGPVAPAATVSPSDLGGAKALPGEEGLNEDAAKLRGARIHLLLEHLPALAISDRSEAAGRILADVPTDERDDIVQEALATLRAPDAARIFDLTALVEVSVTADIGGVRIHGAIDRLIVTDDRVLAVDFKTNAIVPDSAETCPEGLLGQMGAYAAALAEIFPDKPIETAIFWTRSAKLMYLPHKLVSAALTRSLHLDDARPHS